MAYDDELAVAKRAARDAGRIMQEYRETGFEVGRKSAYADLVTEADIACQQHIIETISEAFPEDGFLAEENDRVPDGQDRVWVIDPIDGTRNFTHGFPFYCTSIALKVDEDVVVGVVYTPVQDELFSAVKDDGAELNGDQITVSDTDALRDALIVTRMSDYTASIHQIEHDILQALLDAGASFRRPGAAALDMCQVAAGRVDGHVLVTINEWDIAAGSLIVEEAGGAVEIRDAVTGDYLELVASNGSLQDELGALLEKYVRAAAR